MPAQNAPDVSRSRLRYWAPASTTRQPRRPCPPPHRPHRANQGRTDLLPVPRRRFRLQVTILRPPGHRLPTTLHRRRASRLPPATSRRTTRLRVIQDPRSPRPVTRATKARVMTSAAARAMRTTKVNAIPTAMRPTRIRRPIKKTRRGMPKGTVRKTTTRTTLRTTRKTTKTATAEAASPNHLAVLAFRSYPSAQNRHAVATNLLLQSAAPSVTKPIG